MTIEIGARKELESKWKILENESGVGAKPQRFSAHTYPNSAL